MKKKMFLSRVLSRAFFFSALAFVLVSAAVAQENRPNPTGDANPVAAAGFLGGVRILLPGQTARLAAVNAGKRVIPVQFVFIPVSDQGKIGIGLLREAMVAPGDAGIEKYTLIPDGTSRQLMYFQIRVQNAADLKELVPSLEIYNEQGPGPHYFFGGDGFKEIRPIWVP